MLIKREIKKSICYEIAWMLILAGFVSVSVFLIFHLYEIDLTTMIDVQGDACGLAGVAHDYISGIKSGRGVQVLLNSLFHAKLETSFLHKIGLFLCCLFFDSFGTAANFYYFAGYIFVALGMYIALRMLQKETWLAAIGGVIYTFLPYHYLRGEQHIYLANYYMVPIACAMIIWLLDEQKERNRKFNLICISICVLMGLTDIYYSVFLAIILFFVFIYNLWNKKSISVCFMELALCVIPFLAIAIENIPYLISWFNHLGNNSNAFVSAGDGRTLADLQVYGLRIVQLIYPIQNHRIGLLANFRENLDQYLGTDESRMVTLGLLMTVGLVVSVFILLFSNKNDMVTEEIKKYGTLNVFIILVANIGGLNIFVGLISSSIRCYNRMSIFIAAFSLMTIITILQYVLRKGFSDIRKRVVIILGAALVLCLALLDQTPPFSKADYEYNWELNHNTKKLVEEIDLITDDNASILMLPIITEGVSEAKHDMRNYEQFWPSVYSDNLCWIEGTKEEYMNWANALSVMRTEMILEYSVCEGVEGIWLDENGYDKESFDEIKSNLDKFLGNPTLISETGKQYYYSLTTYEELLDTIYTKEDWNVIERQNELLKTSKGRYYGGALLSIAGGEKVMQDNSLVISSGELQYGPYISLDEGKYELMIVGNQLQFADFNLGYDLGAEAIKYTLEEGNEQIIKITFILEEDVDNMEFILFNDNDMDIRLDYYFLKKVQ